MKYLIYISVPDEFIKKIELFNKKIKKDIIKVPDPLHCTLMFPYFKKNNEKSVVKSLEKIIYPWFKLKTEKIDKFDYDSLVVRTNDLGAMSLHLIVIESLREFIEKDEVPPLLDKYKSKLGRVVVNKVYGAPYYAHFYTPHIKLCDVKPELFDKLDKLNPSNLIDYKWKVKEFCLARYEDSWKLIKKFPLHNREWTQYSSKSSIA